MVGLGSFGLCIFYMASLLAFDSLRKLRSAICRVVWSHRQPLANVGARPNQRWSWREVASTITSTEFCTNPRAHRNNVASGTSRTESERDGTSSSDSLGNAPGPAATSAASREPRTRTMRLETDTSPKRWNPTKCFARMQSLTNEDDVTIARAVRASVRVDRDFLPRQNAGSRRVATHVRASGRHVLVRQVILPKDHGISARRRVGEPCLTRCREPSTLSRHLVTVDAGNRRGRSFIVSPMRCAIWELLSATECPLLTHACTMASLHVFPHNLHTRTPHSQRAR